MTRLCFLVWAGLVASGVLWLATPRDAAAATLLDNPYVLVSRDSAPCAAAAGCGDRVVVAMTPVELSVGTIRRRLGRGEFLVVPQGTAYTPPASGAFFEVALKPDHPPVKSPPEIVPPLGNLILYEGEGFFIYEERLPVGETRARHSHSQRVAIRLNQGPLLEQTRDGEARPTEPGIVAFRGPVIHVTRNVGDMPLRNLVIEFRPETRNGAAR